MSYDPQDHIVEWRDVGAACLLCAIAFGGLLLLGGARPIVGDDEAWSATVEESVPVAAPCQAPACVAAVAHLRAAPGWSPRSRDLDDEDEDSAC